MSTIEGKIMSEGDRIRAAACIMRSRGFAEIADRYEMLALSHDLKDKRDARNVRK